MLLIIGSVAFAANPVLMERTYAKSSKIIGNDSYYANTVKSITILMNNTVPNDAFVSWDISESSNGSIKAWIKKNSIVNGTQMYDLYIGGSGTAIVVKKGSNLFRGYKNCTTIIGLEYLDTSDVTAMDNMFYDCNSLVNFNLDGFDTSNVTTMSYMFSGCNSIVNLDISGFSTANVKNMNSMFYGCNSLVSLNLSNFNTSSVTSMNSVFAGCDNLVSIFFLKSIASASEAVVINSISSNTYIYVLNDTCRTYYREAYSGSSINTGRILVWSGNATASYLVDSKGYMTLQKAYEAISGTSGTITLTQNIFDSSYLEIENGKTITLNLNGYTITKIGSGIVNKGTLKINDNGIIRTNTLGRLIENTGTIEISYSTINNSTPTPSENDWHYTIFSTAGSITLNSGAIIAVQTRGVGIEAYGNTNINIKGGTVNGFYSAIDVYANDTYTTNTGTITITGGIVESPDGIAIIGNALGSRTVAKAIKMTNGIVRGNEYAISYNNKTTGAIEITGGDIVSISGYGLWNGGTGNTIIGTKDGTVGYKPTIRGELYRNMGR